MQLLLITKVEERETKTGKTYLFLKGKIDGNGVVADGFLIFSVTIIEKLTGLIDSWKKDGAGGIAKEVYISVQSPDSPLYPPKITELKTAAEMAWSPYNNPEEDAVVSEQPRKQRVLFTDN